MKLSKVWIENLRAIREPVELALTSPVEVLHGDNNAGKSAILMGVALGLHLMEQDQLWGDEGDDGLVPVGSGGPPPAHVPDFVVLNLPPRFAGLSPHRDQREAPIVVALEITDLVPSVVRFELRKASAGWQVKTTGRPPVRVPWQMVRADHRYGAEDAALIGASRARDDAGGRKRFREVESALRSFVPELGSGTLGVVGDAGAEELAWISVEGEARPFSEEGSGIRSVKDILVSIFGSTADVLLLEEPEVHLSASGVQRLVALIERLANSGKQVVLSSHVYAFDGPGVWRVRRDESPGAGTTVARDSAAYAGLPRGTDLSMGEEQERRLRRLYNEAGQPHVGFVARDGITQLPAELLSELRAPTGVAWTRVREGVYGLVTLRALQEVDEGETDGEA